MCVVFLAKENYISSKQNSSQQAMDQHQLGWTSEALVCEYVGNLSNMTERAKWDDSTMIALCNTKEINYFYCHSDIIQEKNITPLLLQIMGFFLTVAIGSIYL